MGSRGQVAKLLACVYVSGSFVPAPCRGEWSERSTACGFHASPGRMSQIRARSRSTGDGYRLLPRLHESRGEAKKIAAWAAMGGHGLKWGLVRF